MRRYTARAPRSRTCASTLRFVLLAHKTARVPGPGFADPLRPPITPGYMASGRLPRLMSLGKRPSDPDTWRVAPGAALTGHLSENGSAEPPQVRERRTHKNLS